MGKNIIIVILLIAVLGVAGYFIAQNYQAAVPKSSPTEADTTATSSSIAPPEEAFITVINQETTMDEVIIAEAGFAVPGYIVIHVSQDNKPGPVVGSSALMQTGYYQNTAVAVNELKEGENQLFAMIHDDNGDGIYEFPGPDAPAIAENQIVVTPVTITKTAHAADVKVFTITARQFEFEPNLITVNAGDTVRITITSTDVTHGFAIKEFNVNQILEPNQTKTVEFIASKPGTYQMFCSVVCGSGHRDMKGTLVVK